MTMPLPRHVACGLLVLVVGLLGVCGCAQGMVPAVGVQPGRPVQVALGLGKLLGGESCGGEGSLVGEAVNGITGGVSGATGCAAETVAGGVAGAVGNGILNVVAEWVIGAATQVTGFVAAEMQKTTTPQLQSAWFEAQFQPMADLGAALGLLVVLIAFASAAVRRSPEALAGALAGVARAGIGTGLVVALTAIGLGIADEVSSAVLTSSPHTFWAAAAHAWGSRGFGGFGSSALATLIALVEVFAAIFVWLELIVRDAAIYVAVLFFPVVLAASIWPALGSWPGRLGRLLLLFVILKPVAVIVLSLAGSAAAAGLSFGGGVSGSVGTILAATVIFALAAFAPWTLMYLLAADAESAYMAAGLRTAAGAAVTDEDGRSVRSLGGLRNLGGGAGSGGLGSGGGPGGGGPSGGTPGGLGSAGGGEDPGGGGSPLGGGLPGGAAAAEGGAGVVGALEDGTLPVAAESIGGGSVGAAAGIGALAASNGARDSREPGAGSQPQGASALMGAEDASAENTGREPPSGALAGGQPGGARAMPPAAGGAPTGVSPPRPAGGSAGAPAPTEEESSAQPTERAPQPVGGAPLPDGGDTASGLQRSPSRRGRSGSTALTLVHSRPDPAREPAGSEEGEA